MRSTRKLRGVCGFAFTMSNLQKYRFPFQKTANCKSTLLNSVAEEVRAKTVAAERRQNVPSTRISAGGIYRSKRYTDIIVLAPSMQWQIDNCTYYSLRKLNNTMGIKSHRTFGEVLREARVGKYSLRKFAQMVDISPTYLSQVEQGNAAPPTADRVKGMAELLGENADEWIALAGRVADDLPAIINKEPTEVPDLLRAVKGLSSQTDSTIEGKRRTHEEREQERKEVDHAKSQLSAGS